MSIKLTALHVFPLKSGAPLSPDSAEVVARGLQHDRRWMIVDEAGKFVTGRQLPQLVLIRTTPTASGVRLEAPDIAALEIAFPPADAPRTAVTVWDDTVQAIVIPAATDWIERVLGRRLHLAHMDAAAQRAVDADYAQAGDSVSFADAFPLLLISQASLDGLNARLAAPISMLRFRPNLVVSGCAAHAEDAWRRIRIGAVEFDCVKLCTRCVFTTVDPARGVFDPSGEPLKTLKGYRRSPKGIIFGQNLIARGSGIVRLGDPVEPLA